MPTPKITETTIRNLTTPQSFTRGEDYYHTGAVDEVVRRGDHLSAEVQGSSYEPYMVSVELGEGEILSADCTCPYDWGGYCKHIVAVLLTYIRDYDSLAERPTAAELLADLAPDELQELLAELLAQHPHLISWVEQKLAVKKTVAKSRAADTATAPPPTAPPLDPAPFRRRAHDIMSSVRSMRPSEAYWYGGSIVGQIRDLLGEAQPLLEAGDGRHALALLEAVAQVYMDRWLEFDDSDGYFGELFSDIGDLFAEALLSADLTPQERERWAETLTGWQGEVDDYGIDGAFDVAIAAAQQGWDYPPLQAALGGHITHKGAWEGEAPWYADDLALVRLRVLERQGRTTEYLHLAEAEGQTALYLSMLVKLGRTQQALDEAAQYLATTDEALTLAQTLHAHGHTAAALEIAERGLGLHGQTYQLAIWLRDCAAEAAQPGLALQAAQAVFAASSSLENYQAVERIAGAEWPAVKPKLLKMLTEINNPPGKIDIYLHEGLLAEAIKTVDQSGYLGFDSLRRVVEAAIESHPDWAIRQAKRQAESIMDQGKSQHYHHAADWLEKARRAYLAANQAEEWRAYLENLIEKHARKRALRPRLEALRQ